jgi:hypothetical protein
MAMCFLYFVFGGPLRMCASYIRTPASELHLEIRRSFGTAKREIPKNKTNKKRQRGGLAQEPTTHRHGQEVLYVCMYVHLLVVEHLAQEAANWQRPRVHSLHCLDIASFFKTTSLLTILRLGNFALATFWALTARCYQNDLR